MTKNLKPVILFQGFEELYLVECHVPVSKELPVNLTDGGRNPSCSQAFITHVE